MKSRLTGEKLTPGVYQGLNRKAKRKMLKQYHVPMNMMDKVFKPQIEDIKYTNLPDKTKVMLNMEAIEELKNKEGANPSELFLKFVEENKDNELTIDGSNSSAAAGLYSLVEDDGEPKWKFTIDQLIVLNMDDVEVSDEEMDIVDGEEVNTEE